MREGKNKKRGNSRCKNERRGQDDKERIEGIQKRKNWLVVQEHCPDSLSTLCSPSIIALNVTVYEQCSSALICHMQPQL